MARMDPGAEIEPWTEPGVGQIRAGFIDGADAVKPGRRGSSETGQLRKDEPHQVGPLPACTQFGEHGLEDRRLRCYEALQIEAISHCHRKLSVFGRRPRPGDASSIQAGAWSLACSRPRTSRSTPATVRRSAKGG